MRNFFTYTFLAWFATIALGVLTKNAAQATINQVQEVRAEQYCQIDPNFCEGN